MDSFDLYIGPTGTETFVAPLTTLTAGMFLSALTRSESEFSNCFEFLNTGTGQDVEVAVGNNGAYQPQATVTFDVVLVPGATTIAEAETCVGPPTSFTFGGTACWDLETTATFFGSISACFSYDEAQIIGPESALVLLHFDSGINDWVNITTSVDTVNNTICGDITSLSPFHVAMPDLATGVIDHPGAPPQMALGKNYPNPFNPVTTISYDVAAGRDIFVLEIYDVRGRLINTLVRGSQAAGSWKVRWDGTDDSGRVVASGTYFDRLQSSSFSETRRMLLLK